MKGTGHYIKNLISQGEHQQLDFKFEISDAMKMARTFSAFANTDGGTLLIGVKDNGRIAGVHTDEEYYMAESAAMVFCKPEVPFTTEKWTVDGKTVLEIRIPPSRRKPHFAKDRDERWNAFMRVRDENVLVHPVLMKVWKLKKSKKGLLIKYSKNEKTLLTYLASHENITLSHFTRIARVNDADAENILARLISFGLIEIVFTGERTNYKLTEKGLLFNEEDMNRTKT